jgi:hypothetical protein
MPISTIERENDALMRERFVSRSGEADPARDAEAYAGMAAGIQNGLHNWKTRMEHELQL